MSYAIVGFGKIGQAPAHASARKNINVTVASRRPPEALAPEARAIGPTVVAKSLRDALEADTIILAVPFEEHREVAKALPSWEGKTVIDATNAFGVLPEELDGLPSSAFVAKAFTGAKLVKAFNHLVAATLAADPIVEGGHRVVFLSSDDEDAIAPVADLAKQLGFAPVKLGKLNEGGALVHARGRTWGQLIFQDLFKKEQGNGEISMSTQENVQIVKDFFAAMGRGDKQGLLALSAEDIEWIIPGEDWPLAGTHRGHAGLADLLQKANETVETSYPEPPEFIAQGDRVLVVGFARGRIKATNRTWEDHWVFAITVRNGKVTNIREYVNTQALARASGRPASPRL